MLGSVRHRGIIPVDDDGDLCIWKKDATKLQGPVKKELEKHNVFLNEAGGKAYLLIDGKKTDVFCDIFHCIKKTIGLHTAWKESGKRIAINPKSVALHLLNNLALHMYVLQTGMFLT